MKRIPALLLAALLCAPASAGKLDLDLKSMTRPQVRESQAPPPPPIEWKPGDPRNLNGAGPIERTVTHAGYIGLSVAGVVACAAAVPAAAVGFGLIAVFQAYAWLSESKAKPS